MPIKDKDTRDESFREEDTSVTMRDKDTKRNFIGVGKDTRSCN